MAPVRAGRAHLAQEAPQRKIVEVHLKVEVFLDRTPELVDLLLGQLFGAERLVLLVLAEPELERHVHEAIAVQDLAKEFELVLLARLGFTEPPSIVILVRLTEAGTCTCQNQGRTRNLISRALQERTSGC